MGIFSKIKDAIFGKKAQAQQAPGEVKTGNAWADAPVVESTAIEEVDVEAQLDAMPGADGLNWRSSVVDLMKLVGIDSSYENRKELAHELGDADYSGSAEENIALHKRVMAELAANGGKVPGNLLD